MRLDLYLCIVRCCWPQPWISVVSLSSKSAATASLISLLSSFSCTSEGRQQSTITCREYISEEARNILWIKNTRTDVRLFKCPICAPDVRWWNKTNYLKSWVKKLHDKCWHGARHSIGMHAIMYTCFHVKIKFVIIELDHVVIVWPVSWLIIALATIHSHTAQVFPRTDIHRLAQFTK